MVRRTQKYRMTINTENKIASQPKMCATDGEMISTPYIGPGSRQLPEPRGNAIIGFFCKSIRIPGTKISAAMAKSSHGLFRFARYRLII